MNIKDLDSKKLHSPVSNYIIPGLKSWLVGNPSSNGSKERLFEMTREQTFYVTPHCHRFNFTSHVLRGGVCNLLFKEDIDGDDYERIISLYKKEFGKYLHSGSQRKKYKIEKNYYDEGSSYYMDSNEIHSIIFKKGTLLFIEEGPQISDYSFNLNPYVDGKEIPLFETKDWMFLK